MSLQLLEGRGKVGGGGGGGEVFPNIPARYKNFLRWTFECHCNLVDFNNWIYYRGSSSRIPGILVPPRPANLFDLSTEEFSFWRDCLLTHLVLLNSIDGGDSGRFPRQLCKQDGIGTRQLEYGTRTWWTEDVGKKPQGWNQKQNPELNALKYVQSEQ